MSHSLAIQFTQQNALYKRNRHTGNSMWVESSLSNTNFLLLKFILQLKLRFIQLAKLKSNSIF